MRKAVLFAACVLLASSGMQPVDLQGRSAADKILQFDTMAGVGGPYRGSTNPIRGVNGAGIAWVLDEATGELHANGHLEVRVRGLVLATTGVNPQANFRAIVSCLTTNALGQAATENLLTGQFPATNTGDADIEALVALPAPCIAPIVFVTSASGTSWFAATGQ